jgi:anti-sigma-K factor RskA
VVKGRLPGWRIILVVAVAALVVALVAALVAALASVAPHRRQSRPPT